jgi:hypothetical protein
MFPDAAYVYYLKDQRVVAIVDWVAVKGLR